MERAIERKDQMKGSYLGPRFKNEDIQKDLDFLNARYHKKTDEEICKEIATYLKNNKTVGWFQGRMEFGPRALGSRSILGNPYLKKCKRN